MRSCSGPVRAAIAGMLLCAVTLAGCGEGESPFTTGSLSGNVTFDGQPVDEGTVNLIDETQGTGGGTSIVPGGSYVIQDLAVGTYKVSVSPPMEEPSGTPDPNNPPQPKEMPNIPESYRSFETSGLSVTIKEGANELDIEMTAGGGAAAAE